MPEEPELVLLKIISHKSDIHKQGLQLIIISRKCWWVMICSDVRVRDVTE